MSTPAYPEIRPDMSAALADLDELRVLSVRFGYDLFGALANLTKRLAPVLTCEVSDVPAVGADYLVAHFKLTEELHSVLVALRARDSDCHVSHGGFPNIKIPDDIILESYRVLRPGGG